MGKAKACRSVAIQDPGRGNKAARRGTTRDDGVGQRQAEPHRREDRQGQPAWRRKCAGNGGAHERCGTGGGHDDRQNARKEAAEMAGLRRQRLAGACEPLPDGKDA